jgi:hypothetical protein
MYEIQGVDEDVRARRSASRAQAPHGVPFLARGLTSFEVQR